MENDGGVHKLCIYDEGFCFNEVETMCIIVDTGQRDTCRVMNLAIIQGDVT